MLRLPAAAALALDRPGWADRVPSFIDGVVDVLRAHPSRRDDRRDPVPDSSPAGREVASRRRLGSELAVDLREAGIERSGADALVVADVFLAIVQSGVELALRTDGPGPRRQVLLEVRWAATEYLSSHLGQ